MARRLRRAFDSRLRLHHPPGMGRGRPARPDVLPLLLFHDRPARAAHDHRLRHPRHAHGNGPAQPLQLRILRAARSQRPVLAFRGYRVDFPVPAAVSDRRQGRHRGGALMSAHDVPIKTYLGIFVALLVLTGLPPGPAFIDFGDLHTGIPLLHVIPLNTIVALAIPVVKMLLVILFFMHVKYSSGLTKVVVMAGFLFLGILVSLTLADELTRAWSPEPGAWNAVVPTILPLLRGLF